MSAKGKLIVGCGALLGGLFVAMLFRKMPEPAPARAMSPDPSSSAILSSSAGDAGAATCKPRESLVSVTERVVPPIATELALTDAEREQVLVILVERANKMDTRDGLPRVRLTERDTENGKAVEKLMTDADQKARDSLRSTLGDERSRELYKRYIAAVRASYPQGPAPSSLPQRPPPPPN
jgi:hypothetical protein